ncbi:hypothetical protein EDEG_02989 [Edhazardia aedis USNM 41457]|uniref:Uncharacterized protein n=1 Tax=Edhazardia aedis (strain USNM 41457) TaxID=1003232 RepID=J9DJ43_EDHAE|nr:hypothetical protein EDEG_02989 [Edhazardia aedis USNM 41457]|eukprot:EJW02615.1 hypothetical protein EDEG_02989 [Edhazardia aedis USNM 41457]
MMIHLGFLFLKNPDFVIFLSIYSADNIMSSIRLYILFIFVKCCDTMNFYASYIYIDLSTTIYFVFFIFYTFCLYIATSSICTIQHFAMQKEMIRIYFKIKKNRFHTTIDFASKEIIGIIYIFMKKVILFKDFLNIKIFMKQAFVVQFE